MKKLLLTLIVSLAMCGSIFAQYESHWPDFYYPAYESQTPFVAAIEIDGVIITADYPGWDALEIAFFVGDECRGAGVAFGDYTPAVNYLYNGYVEEYGDPFPVIDGAPVYYDNANEEFTVRMYDHLNGIEYNECTVTLEGAPFVLLTGVDNDQGWFDPENPIILHFTSSAPQTCGIVLGETIDFEDATNTELLPLVQHDACWTWTRLVELPADYQDTLPHLYYKTDDDAHAEFAHGDYSLRLWNRGIYAMPALDEDININELKMSFYSRHSYPFYTLMVGVMEDPEDAETFVPVAYVDNGASLNMEYFECNFANYDGEGRYIAFKNVRPSATSFDGNWSDVHSVNYIDDITISLMESGDCALVLNGDANDFESETSVTTKLTGAMPECWEFVQSDVEMMPFDKMPQLYCQASVANSGDYSFRMANRGVVALPELNEDEDLDIHHVRVLMNVRQPNENYQLQVGVWEPVPGAEGGYFVPVALVNNATTDYEFVECGFSNYTGNGTRIAFRNVLKNGVNYDYSYNYIDDITFVYVDENCQEVDEAYTEDFDNVAYSGEATKGVAPDCWDVVREDVEMSYDKYPQVYFNETFANSGAYSLRMVDRCVYAMPELGDVELSEYTLNFYLRQPNPLYQLEVGVWEVSWEQNQEMIETFVPVATFNNENDEPVMVSCDFAEYEGFGNRIAFRNTLKNGRTDLNYSYNYIDDVQLVLTDQAKNNASSESVIDAMNADQYLENIAVYPNPTVGELHIDAVDVQMVECYNQMGQLVAVYNNESDISLNSLANGVYTLRITVPQGVTMRKVVKE